jgi:2C-methyl-D-erythritol 2,4-cyclodiphosphate synthase
MNPRQPTRWLKKKMTKVDTTMIKTSGKTHVGRCTIDSNVGLGLKRTPKIRATELVGFAGSGDGIAGLAITLLHNQKSKGSI